MKCQEERGTTEDEMVGWHHWLKEHEFEQTQGDSDDREAWRAAGHGVAEVGGDWATQQQDMVLFSYMCLHLDLLRAYEIVLGQRLQLWS